MKTVERRQARVERPKTLREERALLLEAAALEVEVRGWSQGLDCDFSGRVCAVGGVIFASGYKLEAGENVLDERFDAATHVFGLEGIFCLSAWNDRSDRTADEVTTLLRWRAEEIRDGL